MRLGALLGPVDDPTRGQLLADQARAFADAGYTSLWSAQAIGRGFMMTDPFVALTVAATAVPGIEVGTAVLQVPLYHPMDLAHRVFSLQQVSGDKFIFGVGAGSTAQDFATYERNYDSRFADFNASLARLRGIFATGGDASGQLSPWAPLQGGPPLFYGTWGQGVARAATEFDGWIASGMKRNVDEVCDALAGYRQAGGGRAIVSTIQVSGETDLDELSAKLNRWAEAGFDDAVVMLLPGAPAPAEIMGLLA